MYAASSVQIDDPEVPKLLAEVIHKVSPIVLTDAESSCVEGDPRSDASRSGRCCTAGQVIVLILSAYCTRVDLLVNCFMVTIQGYAVSCRGW